MHFKNLLSYYIIHGLNTLNPISVPLKTSVDTARGERIVAKNIEGVKIAAYAILGDKI